MLVHFKILFEEVLDMDYDIQKAAYDARFKEITDQANIIETAVSDSRALTIQTLMDAGFSTELILNSGFTIEQIDSVKISG